jgi:pimeloyl-ACP methyl ester carboxylesterase
VALPAATGAGLSGTLGSPRATVVLVHGAWHGPWCWQLLLPHLVRQGLAVLCPALPSAGETPAGLAEDASLVSAVLRDIAGPVVLCGHSYGGLVISAVDTSQGDIRRLVYLCAYMPEAGESLETSLRNAGERRPGHWVRRLPDGRTQVDGERAAALFYQDCPDTTQSWAIGQLRPHWAQVLSQTVAQPAWQRHTSTYVLCNEDQALAPRIQREVYGPRAQQVVTLHSSHSPFLSQPRQLAQVLADQAL